MLYNIIIGVKSGILYVKLAVSNYLLTQICNYTSYTHRNNSPHKLPYLNMQTHNHTFHTHLTFPRHKNEITPLNVTMQLQTNRLKLTVCQIIRQFLYSPYITK